jgi:hypothetical protein
MDRLIEPELLDELPPEDMRARRGRRDLRRLNAWMGNAWIMAQALRSAFQGRAPQRIIELGAGDGCFLLHVARRLARDWHSTTVTLLDRQPVVSLETQKAFDGLGWQVEILQADVFDWLRQPSTQACEVMATNLFLHHFSAAQLGELLRESARRARVFVAVEPRRSAWALAFSRLVGLIGCGQVTRHDAPVSVRAGFAGQELSRLWPAGEHWALYERPAGLFSHLFVAQRR